MNLSTAIKYDTKVKKDGKLDLSIPHFAGKQVVVLIFEEELNDFSDLVLASKNSLDFWDNSFDDEDWNDV